MAYKKSPEYQKRLEILENARLTGQKTYFSGVPCRYGHVGERYTNGRNCVDCIADPQYRELLKLGKRGITKEQYDNMLQEQNNNCAICTNPLGTGQDVAIDHCHKTNKVRGILCRWCNMGLGLFRDKIRSLENAAIYLKKQE